MTRRSTGSSGVNPWLKVGEAFMDGTLTIEDGTLYDFRRHRDAQHKWTAGRQDPEDAFNVINRMLRWWHQHNPVGAAQAACRASL